MSRSKNISTGVRERSKTPDGWPSAAGKPPRFFDREWFWSALAQLPSGKYTKELTDSLVTNVPPKFLPTFVLDEMFSTKASLDYTLSQNLTALALVLEGEQAEFMCRKLIDSYYTPNTTVYYTSPYRAASRDPQQLVEFFGCYMQTVKSKDLRAEVVDLLADLIVRGYAQKIGSRNRYMYSTQKGQISVPVAYQTLKLFSLLAPPGQYMEARNVVELLTSADPKMVEYKYNMALWSNPVRLQQLKDKLNAKSMLQTDIDLATATADQMLSNSALLETTPALFDKVKVNPNLSDLSGMLSSADVSPVVRRQLYKLVILEGFKPSLPERNISYDYYLYEMLIQTSGFDFDRYRSWLVGDTHLTFWVGSQMQSKLVSATASYTDEQFRQLYVGVLRNQDVLSETSPPALWFLSQGDSVEFFNLCESLLQSATAETTIGTLLDTAASILART